MLVSQVTQGTFCLQYMDAPGKAKSKGQTQVLAMETWSIPHMRTSCLQYGSYLGGTFCTARRQQRLTGLSLVVLGPSDS